ncbi:hypothetical protein C5Y44_08880 [Corynebacterium sp. J010B-136]|nr:hypothetical protein C5Y44_08880 [Corynebacterium sp. J010B-136]
MTHQLPHDDTARPEEPRLEEPRLPGMSSATIWPSTLILTAGIAGLAVLNAEGDLKLPGSERLQVLDDPEGLMGLISYAGVVLGAIALGALVFSWWRGRRKPAHALTYCGSGLVLCALGVALIIGGGGERPVPFAALAWITTATGLIMTASSLTRLIKPHPADRSP